MARSSLLLPLCLLPFFFALSLSADTSYCTTIQASLTTSCLGYLESTTTAPPSSACCTALKPTLSAANLNNTVQCLCALGTASGGAALQQKALQLPKNCNITVNISSSPCSANSSNSTSGSSSSAGVLSAFGPSYVAITFTSLISSVFTGALLI